MFRKGGGLDILAYGGAIHADFIGNGTKTLALRPQLADSFIKSIRRAATKPILPVR